MVKGLEALFRSQWRAKRNVLVEVIKVIRSRWYPISREEDMIRIVEAIETSRQR